MERRTSGPKGRERAGEQRRDSERKREGSRGKRGRRARERGERRDGARGPPRQEGPLSREPERRGRTTPPLAPLSVRESEVAAYLCRGTRRGPKPRRMRGGRGNARLCPDKPSSALFLSLSLSRARSCPFYLRLARSERVARSRARIFPSPTARPPLVLLLALPKGSARSLSIAVGTHRRAAPITAECARSKAPRARVVIRSGVLSIWVIANANKDNTWRTIMSRNYSAYRNIIAPAFLALQLCYGGRRQGDSHWRTTVKYCRYMHMFLLMRNMI